MFDRRTVSGLSRWRQALAAIGFVLLITPGYTQSSGRKSALKSGQSTVQTTPSSPAPPPALQPGPVSPGSPAIAPPPPADLKISTPVKPVPLGAAFEIGLALSPGVKLNGAVVTDVRFVQPSNAWNISRDWQQVIAGGSIPADWLWSARLQAFETGEQRLPEVSVTLRRPDGETEHLTLTSPQITIVEGIAKDVTELHGLRDIHPFRFNRALLYSLVAGGLLAVALIAFFIRKSILAARARPAPVEPPLPPVEWALREIERRRAMPTVRQGSSKLVATEVSDVIRHFLQRQFGFKALEMTTAECVDRLRATLVPHGLTEKVAAFLGECDFAKFTRLDLAPDRREGLWDDARAIVGHAAQSVEAPSAPSERMEEEVALR